MKVLKKMKYLYKHGLTILLVPDDGKRLRRIKIPLWSLSIGAGVMVTFLVALGIIIGNYCSLVDEHRDYTVLKKITRSQRLIIHSYQDRIVQIENKIQELADLEKKVRLLVNLEPSQKKGKTLAIGPLSSENKSVRNSQPASLSTSLSGPPSMSSLEELTGRIKDAEAQLHTLQVFLEDRHSLLSAVPSIWPVRGWVTSGFGNRLSPFSKKREMHYGLDIATRRGDPIVAPADGVVSSVGRERGFGRIIRINHGYGVETVYAHLSQALVTPGQKVRRHQKFALVGNTGRSTGPHLHYEIRKYGVPVNPQKYLPE